jgi:transposase
MSACSWDGRRTKAIADELGCHPQTVRERIHRFNDEGLDGLGDRSGAGRKRRITETERSLIISLVGTDPPGRLVRASGGELEATDENTEAHWMLDALTAARERRIAVGRSQVRRILFAEGVRWRNPHPWGESHDPQFVPKERGSSTSTSRSPRTPRPSAWRS